jgi:putative lipoic acid-binding regulatory protein
MITVKLLSIILLGLLFFSILNGQVLTSINPDNGEQGEYLFVSITGQDTNFDQGTDTLNNVWFTMGSSTINSTNSYPNSNTILNAYFDIPDNAEIGVWDLFVQNSINGTLSLNNSFTISMGNPDPAIVSIDPNNAQQGEYLSVSITGQETHFNQGTDTINNVWFAMGSSTISAISSFPNSNTSLSADFDIPNNAEIGNWDVFVNNDIDGTMSLNNGFIIVTNNPNPAIVSINPDNGEQGEYLFVSITGQDTNFDQGTDTLNNVWFTMGSSTINSTNSYPNSNTILNAYFDIPDNAEIGVWDLFVQNSINGTLSLNNSFTISMGNPDPAIVSIDPNNAQQGEYLSVSITGQETHFNQGTDTINNVWFAMGSSTISAISSFPNSNTSLSADFDIPNNAEIGNWDVFVNNDIDGTMSLNNGFIINLGNTPPSVIIPIDEIDTDEDFTEIFEIDLNEHFTDPDGDELTYSFVIEDVIALVEIDNNTLSISAVEDLFGSTEITVIADDNFDIRTDRDICEMSFDLTINAINDSPEIISFIPEEFVFEINIEQEITFSVVAEDIDSQLEYAWFINQENINCPDNSFSIYFDENGNFEIICLVSDEEYELETVWNITSNITDIGNNLLAPSTTKLVGNYPNPFNPTTTIKYNLKETGFAQIVIYNIKGQTVNTLVDQNQDTGFHSVLWNGKDSSDIPVSSGFYLYKLIVNNRTIGIKKSLLLK